MLAFLKTVWGRKKNFLAVDVGTSFIKIAEVKWSRKPIITALYRIPTPEGVFSDGLRVEVLAEALEAVVKEYSLENKRVVSAIYGDKVITRHIKVPAMPERELERAVRWEAEKVIPIPVKDLIIQFMLLGNHKDVKKSSKQLPLLVAAVAPDIVYMYHNAFEQAGLQLAVLDLQVLALWRLFRKGAGLVNPVIPDGNKTVAVADIGASTTHIMFIKCGTLKYSRAVPVGGNAITGAIQAELAVDWVMARQVKERQEVLPGNSKVAAGAGSPAVRLQSNSSWLPDHILYAGVKDLVKELRFSLDYYQTQEKESPVEKLLVTGGESKVEGLVPLLSRALNVPVETAVLNDGNRNVDGDFALVMGLALRKVNKYAS